MATLLCLMKRAALDPGLLVINGSWFAVLRLCEKLDLYIPHRLFVI